MTECSEAGVEDGGVLRGQGQGRQSAQGHQATIVVSGVIRAQRQMKVFGKFAKCWERALGDSNIWGTSTKSETHLYNAHLTFNKWETH
jgi:hypothetical protein